MFPEVSAMPIKIPESLPAKSVLEKENIFVMTEQRAIHQDIRPLRLIILNLMPIKIVTETQLLRCLSNSPLQVEIELLQTSSYISKNTPEEHLLSHYTTFEQIRGNRYDGLIITGAPVETMPFDKVDYWDELCAIMEWSKTNVFSVFHICWGAQAALFYHYGIEKHPMDHKVFGVFEHDLIDKSYPLVRGFDDVFRAPHSRHTEVRTEDILACPELKLLASSKKAGVYLAISRNGRHVFVTGHSEYDADTLKLEYLRDVGRGLDIDIPYNYFPEDNPGQTPRKTWRSHGHLLYSNWLNYYVYQNTPYNLESMALN